MCSDTVRRAGVLALTLFSLTVAAGEASALSADRTYKDLEVSKRFAREDQGETTVASRAAAQRARPRAATARPGASGAAAAQSAPRVRQAPRNLDFSQVGRSTFSAPARGRASTAAAAAPVAAAQPRFAAPATASPASGGESVYGALPPARPAPSYASRRADPTATGSLYDGLTKSDSPYGWLVTVNVKGVMSPKYTGAASYGFVGYPTLSFRRPGMPEKWSSPDDSITLNLYDNERFAIGPAVAYRGGRYRSDAPELAGIHKPRWSLEGGVFADVWLAPNTIRLHGELRRGMRGRDGVNGSLGADYVYRAGQLTLALGPRLKFGNDTFMRNQFGVTVNDSLANPRYAAYNPKADLYAAGVYGSATYKQNEHWSYTLHGGYDRLRGEAGRSPIIRSSSGTRDQWTIGAIISYTFGVGVGGR